MILNSLSTLLKNILLWVSNLLPEWSLSQELVNAVSEFWDKCWSWSGVFPLRTILAVFGVGITYIIAINVWSLIRFVINLVRGAGA